jgi:hypothetical protein
MSLFPVKSTNRVVFARPGRLTGGLPDVGKARVLHRNLIRLLPERPCGARLAESAFKVPSLRISPLLGPTVQGII